MEEKKICGAKAKSSGKPCQRAPMANGRCMMHGGKSPGANPEKMRGNKNALKTGEYETIWVDTLEEEEKELLDVIDLDVLRQLDDEIRLITIRERRMMRRISDLKKKDFIVTDITEVDGVDIKGAPAKSTTTRQENTLLQIQAIEEALTRVQDKKAKLLELKHKMTQEVADEEEGDALESLSQAIRDSHKMLGNEEE